MADTAFITSDDGNFTVNAAISQDPNGLYVIDVTVSSLTGGGDTLNVRVNGIGVWQGEAVQDSGGE